MYKGAHCRPAQPAFCIELLSVVPLYFLAYHPI
jgi:hypothetical protein